MSKINHIKLLENLSKQKKINKNFNRKFRLEKQGFIEQSQELFKPIIEQQEKTNENILKAIEQKPNQIPAIEQNPNQIVLPPIEKVHSNNSIFIRHLEDNNKLLLRLSQRNTPQIKIDKTNTGILTIYPKSGEEFAIKNTQGLSELLFRKTIDFSKVTEEDRKTYDDIYKILGEKTSTSKRAKDIRNFLPKHFGNGIVTISENPEELFKRLEILLAAKSQGHNNSKDEISAILDELLKQKQIDKKQYLSIYN